MRTTFRTTPPFISAAAFDVDADNGLEVKIDEHDDDNDLDQGDRENRVYHEAGDTEDTVDQWHSRWALSKKCGCGATGDEEVAECDGDRNQERTYYNYATM